MRHFLFAALLIGATTPALAAERDFPSSGFDKVDFGAAGKVEVHSGSRFAVHASGDPKWLNELNVRVVQGTLMISWLHQHFNMNGHDPLHISISMPRVVGVTLSGAGTVMVDRAEGADFGATIRGAGTVDVAALHTDRAQFEMSGAGKISAAGSAQSVDAHVRGVGAIEIEALAARAGRFDMSGTGSIKARVDGPADATMNGMGSIDVTGNARCTVHKHGFGSVHCG